MPACVGPTFQSQGFGERNKLLSVLGTEQRSLGRRGEEEDFRVPTGIESVLNVAIKGKIQEMNPVFQPAGFKVTKLNSLESHSHFVGTCTTHLVRRFTEI
jgi:hypothetical protein